MNMPEFLAENNVCGQTTLQLVSRGNAIIAELLRLEDYIPKIYRLETKQDVQKYGEIILDFSYFKIAEAQENKIESNEQLRDIDEEFRDNHIEIINRFYLAFESIHTYVSDLNHFLDELEDGMYIHQSLETIFADMEGRQLMCEALYLYGLMLLIVDAFIDGCIRERLLVSYYRYTPQRRDTPSCIDEVCKLLRDTGYASAKRPTNYPEDYYKRIPIKANFVDIVIGRLRSDDIYNQLSVYPFSKHRSTALATQASMLYICLFFLPNILHSHTAIMREIVDKYFPDNWIISIYMGFTVNLIESWEGFKAAKIALNNTLEIINIKSYANSYGNNVAELLQKTNSFLKEGNITSENLLSEINNIIVVLRECNVTLKWLMLHTVLKPGKTDKNKKCRQLREIVMTECKYSPVTLFKLLLNTAQLELVTKDIFKSLLSGKEEKWNALKEESYNSLVELSDVFSGTKPLTRIEKNVNLQKWFLEISKQVNSLDQNSASSRKIVQLIQALEEVQEFHQLESNMQVVQFLQETRKCLHHMIRTMNVKEDVLITMQIIGDLSYAWELIDSYTPIMQTGIKREPTLVIKLRSIFLKLASALEIPLLRINQAHSEDLISVSQYYSSELEIYIRKVLQIIPEMMFEKMARIIQIQTTVLKEIPTRLEKDKLKEYAQLNERFEFAELTHSISVFSEGMRMMKSTLVGVVCLDPKKLLEDGIRKELVLNISKALHSELTFNSRPKNDELEERVKNLGHIMDGYKRSFEYIQDYVNINGLKIWQEEVTRIVNFNVEQECNGFLRNKVHMWESAYQNRYVPIPYYPPTDNVSENFIGRLAREIIRLTDPKNSIYVHQMTSWIDAKTQKPIFNKQTVKLIASAIEITGLVGLDRLFSFMIITNLKKINSALENRDLKNSSWNNVLCGIIREMKNFEKIPNVTKFYQNCINRSNKIWADFLDWNLLVGQLQLLRSLIAFHLNMCCKFNAKNLESSLNSFNMALLSDIKGEYCLNEELLSALSLYLDYAGLHNPMNKIYLTSNYKGDYAVILFVFVIAHLQKLFVLKMNNLNKKSQDHIDSTALIVAIHTILKQFHTSLSESFIGHVVQYIIELTKNSINLKNVELPSESITAVRLLEQFCIYSKSSNDYFINAMPEEIHHLYDALDTAST